MGTGDGLESGALESEDDLFTGDGEEGEGQSNVLRSKVHTKSSRVE